MCGWGVNTWGKGLTAKIAENAKPRGFADTRVR